MGLISKLPRRWRKPIGETASHTYTFFRILSWALRPKTPVTGLQPSVLIPTVTQDTPELQDVVECALAIIAETRKLKIESLNRLNHEQMVQANGWPGEHYRLLKASVNYLRPRLVVEIGTFTGLGSLAMLEAMASGARLVTYDLVPWDKFPDTVLVGDDFTRGFEQRIGNLADREFFECELPVLMEADLIFMDGPKNGTFEQDFVMRFLSARRKPCVMIWDDTRFLQMAELWRALDEPKIDITSFGHWTGTGFIKVRGKERRL